MDHYLLAKALHVAAIVTWIGGMLVMGIVLFQTGGRAGDFASGERRLIAGIRRWDRQVTTPAMLLAWVLGMLMAILGEWFTSPWLLIKLAIVFALSGLHGAQGAALRRLEADGATPSSGLRYSAPLTLAGVIAVAILVVTKPF